MQPLKMIPLQSSNPPEDETMIDPTAHYFDEWARRLRIDGLDAAELHEKLEPLTNLEHGPTSSRLGGRITKDLKRLSPEEFDARRRQSERFLKRPAETFPADEACT